MYKELITALNIAKHYFSKEMKQIKKKISESYLKRFYKSDNSNTNNTTHNANWKMYLIINNIKLHNFKVNEKQNLKLVCKINSIGSYHPIAVWHYTDFVILWNFLLIQDQLKQIFFGVFSQRNSLNIKPSLLGHIIDWNVFKV